MLSAIFFVFALAAVAAYSFFLGKRAGKSVSSTKRFGLREAKSAMRWVQDKETAQPLLGVVVGVLGYENAVAQDVQVAINKVMSSNLDHAAEKSEAEDTIGELRARIAELEAMISDNDRRTENLKDIEEIFRS